jgi:ferredoxin, 2Fe-2S
MPKIEFVKNRAPIEVPVGANLMRALQNADIPVASSCDGDGVCVKCRMQILDGAKNLSPENDLEQHLRDMHNIPKNERVSCQVEVLGDIKINASYW